MLVSIWQEVQNIMFSGKKILCAVVSAALIFSTLTIGTPSARAEIVSEGAVNTQNTHLREAPSTASNIIATMNEGETVSVLGTESLGWYQIQYQGSTGYARMDFIDVMISGLNESAVMLCAAEMKTEPDAQSMTLANLQAETQVTVTGSYGGTYQIEVDSKTGYVPKTSVHIHKIVNINLKANVNSSGVNLRSEPSTASEVLSVLSKGTQVTAQSIQDKWIKVSCSGGTGYISGEFITYTVSNNTNITTLCPGMTAQAVKVIQTALKKKGFYYPAIDGIYGSGTKEAVTKFQKSMCLNTDGIAGPQTLLVLLGTDGVSTLWNNYRASMTAQKPQKNGRVWLVDWFDTDNSKGIQSILPTSRTTRIIFEVIDVRTGISWNMERFGDITAHWHADVCPITKKDTEKMTEAWGGELNATRRPVWVKYDGKYYAASLMGYVHNTDPISDNGMDGQVCLHFRGSLIHSSARVDEAHQACISEAFAKADKLAAYIEAGKV